MMLGDCMLGDTLYDAGRYACRCWEIHDAGRYTV